VTLKFAVSRSQPSVPYGPIYFNFLRFIYLLEEKADGLQLTTSLLIDAYHIEPVLRDAHPNASETKNWFGQLERQDWPFYLTHEQVLIV